MLNQTEFNNERLLGHQCVQVREDGDRCYTTAMFVRFTSYHKRVACGEIRTLQLRKVFCFCGLDHLLLIMEDVMDYINASCVVPTFPQSTFHYRSIRGGRAFQEMDNAKNITEFDFQPEQQVVGSFVAITVYYRQHASIQGELRIAGRKILFRSGLELMRLLHQELKHSAEEIKATEENL